ncbi:MAG: YjfB family protein [Butyrivibrio sp.]|nr:YjfB family protein [Butyrivibrio sp.]
MDIPALSMALSQSRLLNDVGVAMLSKSLDTMQESGEAMIASMDAVSELSVNPDIGANIDIRI